MAWILILPGIFNIGSIGTKHAMLVKHAKTDSFVDFLLDELLGHKSQKRHKFIVLDNGNVAKNGW